MEVIGGGGGGGSAIMIRKGRYVSGLWKRSDDVYFHTGPEVVVNTFRSNERARALSNAPIRP